METYRTDDGSVAKMIHADGSETAIKCVLSQSTFIDAAGKLQTAYADRQKYSVFISSSVGCYMQCPFCHLTIKDSTYQKITGERILRNLQEALDAELAARPELTERYVKLCWMGMGDALNQPVVVREVTLALLDWLFAKGYARGLDSVDLSTVMPPVGDSWIAEFDALNVALARYPHNPESAQVEQAELASHSRYTERSTFRLFYSLHSAVQATRDRMVPRALPLGEAIPLLHRMEDRGVSVLLHHLFVEGLNDGAVEIDALTALLAAHFPDNELRILRYNSCDRSPYHEWGELQSALDVLLAQHKRLKVQMSAGKEVQAACGQFLVAMPRARQELLRAQNCKDGTQAIASRSSGSPSSTPGEQRRAGRPAKQGTRVPAKLEPYADPAHPNNGPEHHTGKKCIEKGCENPAGTSWSTFWCQPCNAKRMERISANLQQALWHSVVRTARPAGGARGAGQRVQ